MTRDDDPRARLSKLRHDLRTPLNQIIGYAEMLAEDAPPALRQDLERIRSAALTELAHVSEAIELLGRAMGGEPAPVDPGHAPPEPPPPTAAPTPAPDVDAPADGPAASSAVILVVDDDEANRDMLARRLRRCGYHVDTAPDGPTALALAAGRAYALVILDVMMPGMDGLEVLRRLRATHALAELPVIMATACDADRDVVDALALGANDYVVKPINLPVLLARVKTRLDLAARNKLIRSAFGRYLTDEIVDSLLATPDGLALGGESRIVTVLMADLRGFTSIAERLSPPQVIALLNNFLAAMTEVICRHGGTIDEFIGDAVLVIFGAPTARSDDARRAVTCAVQMQRAMSQVNAQNAAQGLPLVEMGVGVNTGEVVVGNIGSERRAKYGVVGRHVNLASRVQAYSVGGQILVSQSTLDAAGPGIRIDGALEAFPKGSKAPMRVYEVGGVDGTELSRRTTELVSLAAPVLVRFRVLDGTHIPSSDHAGVVTHVSPRQARLVASVPVAPLSTVLFDLSGEIYAKVLAVEEPGGGLLLHFTSIAPSAAEALAARIAGSDPPR